MDSQPGSVFSRRYDRNGTIVFTLSTTFEAVAVSLLKTAFEKAESEHTGNPEMLNHWKTFIDELKQRERSREPDRSN